MNRSWIVLAAGLILFAPVALGSASDDVDTADEGPAAGANATEEANATIAVADLLAENQTPSFEDLAVPLDAPPGLGSDDPWVDANGDQMFGALEMGPNVIRLNGRALAATLDGDLQFAGDSVCLQEAGNCEGQTLTGETPIVVDGSTILLSSQGCADGELWKWTGSTWDCQPDDDTTYDGSDFALSDQACASGEVVSAVNSTGSIQCVTDQDTDNDTLAELDCSSDEIARWVDTDADDTADTWVCSVDEDTTYDGSDFALSDQSCASVEVVTGVDANGNVVCKTDETVDAWLLGGNAGVTEGEDVLGTTDAANLTVVVDGTQVATFAPTDGTPKIVAGNASNVVAQAVEGAVVAGGGTGDDPNEALEDFATVSGGLGNVAQRPHDVVAGGLNNTADGRVCGSFCLEAPATVGGGEHNEGLAIKTTISGGANNTVAEGAGGGTVGGGEGNTVKGIWATVGGGEGNTANGGRATVAGGAENTANGGRAFVGGGGGNNASGHVATIAGGVSNLASGIDAVVGGGFENTASEGRTFVGGGGYNTANGSYAALGGGEDNIASGWRAFVGGGEENTASGRHATVAGGNNNTASGDDGVVPGGSNNKAQGSVSLAAGGGATAAHPGTFVWSDGVSVSPDSFVSTGKHQFLVQAAGGVGIGSENPVQNLNVTKAADDGGSASIDNYAVHIDHQSSSVEGLAISSDDGTPGDEDDFVAFFDGTDTAIGSIQGDGSGGVRYTSGGADLAEYFPKTTPAAPVTSGDVVGLHDGEVRLDTEGADAVFVVSTAPAFVGNKPADTYDDGEEDGAPLAEPGDEHAPLALTGQVPTKVEGPVAAGEVLVPAGSADGTAVAASTTDASAPTIGIALEDHAGPGPGEVRTLVGAGLAQASIGDDTTDGDLAERVDELEAENEQLEQENAELRQRLDAIEERLDEMDG